MPGHLLSRKKAKSICLRKRKFLTRPKAVEAITLLRVSGRLRIGQGKLVAYRCPLCCHWHIGNRKPVAQQKSPGVAQNAKGQNVAGPLA
jgi:hypothetical protein